MSKRIRLRRPRFSIGIDFGTTMSRLCYVPNYHKGPYEPPYVKPVRSVVLPNPTPEREPKIYSWLLGKNAINNRSPDIFRRFKLDIGKMQEVTIHPFFDDPDQTIDMRPEILAARIMWELYQYASRVNNTELAKYRDITVTVPAEWNATQREATLTAAKIAKFGEVNLIEEPVAAYLARTAYPTNEVLKKAQSVLVFDYGGGTLDITVIHRPDNRGLPYIASRSMEHKELGGEFIDDLLSEKLVVGEKVWNDLSRGDQYYIADITRQLKESLNPRNLERKPNFSANWNEEIDLKEGKYHYQKGELVLCYDDIEKQLKPVMHRVEEYIHSAMVKAKSFGIEGIEAVIMVGGSSYLRVVQDLIRAVFGGKTFGVDIFLDKPEKLVAIGAALYQSSLDSRKKIFQLRVPMLTYLEYTVTANDNEESKPRTKELGGIEDRLPIHYVAPPTVPIPKNTTKIAGVVKQEHAYSDEQPDVIERFELEEHNGKADRLRLGYKIDLNGRITCWKPALVLGISPVAIEESRHYDWLNIDHEKQFRKYTIDNPDPLNPIQLEEVK